MEKPVAPSGAGGERGMLVRSRWAPMYSWGSRKKGGGTKVPPKSRRISEAQHGWADKPAETRSRCFSCPTDFRTGIRRRAPQRICDRRRLERTSRHREGGLEGAASSSRRPASGEAGPGLQRDRGARNPREQNRKGPVTPFRATVAPSRAWRGSRFRVDRATLRSLPPVGWVRRPTSRLRRGRKAFSTGRRVFSVDQLQMFFGPTPAFGMRSRPRPKPADYRALTSPTVPARRFPPLTGPNR